MSGIQGTEITGKGIRPHLSYRVKTYDFKRPDKFSKDQIRTLSILHETFARLTATTLSAMCRAETLVHVAMVDQVTYEEFIATVPNPAALLVVHMPPLQGACLFQYPNEIVYEMVDRIHGGYGKSFCPNRDLSSIEMDLLENAHEKIFANFREAWSTVFETTPELMGIESNKHFCQIVPPTEMIVYTNIEIKLGDVEASFNIAYPYVTIEPIISKLSVAYVTSPRATREGTRDKVKIGNLESELEVAVDGPELSVNELIGLRTGDYLPLSSIEDGSGYLLLNGTPIETCTWDSPEAMQDGSFKLPERICDPTDSAQQLPTRTESVEQVKLLAKEIVQELNGEYRSLTGRLDEIAGRQDDLTDQIAFSENIDENSIDSATNPFSYIHADDAEAFVPLISHEHPQTITLILSYLEPHTAAAILGELSIERKIDVAERLSNLGRIAPEALGRLDSNVRKLFEQFAKTELANTGGVGRLAEILNVTNRSVEKEIIESLESDNPDLAEKIKQRMLVFEDISLLDTKAVARVVEASRIDDIALALRGVMDRVKTHVFEGCDERRRTSIEELIEKTGPVRLSDVEKAQMRVVSTIRKLEDKGIIHIARADEQIV